MLMNNGTVTTAPGWAEAYRAFVDGGWNGLAADPDHGGQGLPHLLGAAATEIWNGANLAFSLCPILTAGGIEALVAHGVRPEQGEVLVTGSTGGVGSVAVALLAKAGFKVVAATGKAAEGDYLKQLGASGVIDRAELAAAGKPLQKERWAGVVDSVGSHTLANACAQTRYGGAVAACGLAQGMDFPASVAPFILRGVALLGIDSVMAPKARRMTAWARLGRDLNPGALDVIAREIKLADAIQAGADLLAGKVRGRLVVNVNA